MQIAIYISDHGFGHTTRMVALMEELIRLGVYCHIRCKRPAFLFNELDPQSFTLYDVSMDLGIVNGSELRPDISATREKLLDLMSLRQPIVEREVEFLRSNRIDLVIADIPFLIAEVGKYAGVKVFAISNFDWYYIYRELFKDDRQIRPVINCIGALYGLMDHAFRLPFSSVHSMAALGKCEKTGMVTRRTKDPQTVINALANKPKPYLLCTSGGIGEITLDIRKLCSAFKGTVISRYRFEADNYQYLDPETDFIDYIAAADIILTKPGYSTFAETVTQGKFLIYHMWTSYPENTLLEKGLRAYKHKLRLDDLHLTVKQWSKTFSMIERIKANTDQKEIPNQTMALAQRLLDVFHTMDRGERR
ncbi:MAG: hypothetical protein FJ042_05245 [Candidatus Cloacimonetes bacterium]|nr:hypothetical protein [Candidatus Cloacimonadota bacterium]